MTAATTGCWAAWTPRFLRVHRHRVGWIAFIVSAVLFGVAGARAGDWLVVAASAVFGVACILFLKSD